MFFARFLLFSILVYNTEARTTDDKHPTGTYSDILGKNATTTPVKITAPTNHTRTNDGSRIETRYYDSVPIANNTPTEPKQRYNKSAASEYTPPTTGNYSWYVETPAESFISTDNKTEKKNSTRRPYYSYWSNGLKNSRNTTALTEDSETTNTTARIPYYSYWGNGIKNSRKTTALTEDFETTTTTRTPYYSHWGNGLKKSRNTTALTEESDATSPIRSYDSYWGNERKSETTASNFFYNWYNRITTESYKQPAHVTEKPYDHDVGYGYLTVENGTVLTANFPESLEKTNDTNDFSGESIEKYTNTRLYNLYWGSDRDSETTTTRRPYNHYWDREHDSATTTTRRPYNHYWDREHDSVTTTTRRPYNHYWDREHDSNTTTTRRPYNHYWDREHDSETTTTRRRYNHYWDRQHDSETTTTRKPYNHYWDREHDSENKTTRRWYNHYWDREHDSETTTTRRRYNPYWHREHDSETTTTRRPYNRYWDRELDSETTTTRRPNTVTVPDFWKNGTSRYAGGTEYNQSNNNETTTARDIVIDPIWPTSPRSPVELSINSSIITINETRNYGAIAEFLKKLSRTVLPSTSNLAPNSNIKNLAITNENGGNMFFYMNNYF